MKVNNSYSLALYEIYKDEKKKNKFYEDIQSIYFSLRENPDIVRILSSRMLPKIERKEIIKKIFDKKINNYIRNFLYVLIDDEYFRNIREIMKSSLRKIDFDQNQMFVKIETAYKLDEVNLKKLLSSIRKKWNKKVDYTMIVNESLIGGIKIFINDKEIDGSIEGKLRKIKKDINSRDRFK